MKNILIFINCYNSCFLIRYYWFKIAKGFIGNSNARKQLSSGELKAIKKELVQTHITWITTFRYQIRADKPWETYLKKNKQNATFKEKHYFIFQNKTDIE